MDTKHDLYPSRLGRRLDMFERLDPVVYDRPRAPGRGPLSEEQVATYERDGYLFFPEFFTQSEIHRFSEELRRLSRDTALAAEDGVIREPESDEVRSVFDVHKRSELFAGLMRDPRVLDRARQLLDSDVYIHQSRINYKPGFKGKGFNWHSDFETWHAEDGMPKMRALSCSIILTDNHQFNGPLMLIPGSHKYFVPCTEPTPEDNYKMSLRSQTIGVPDEGKLGALMRRHGIQAPTGKAGSLLLFECNTLHGSNANMSPDPRSNVFFVYNGVTNTPREPYGARTPRPAFLGEREDFTPLRPL